MALGTVQLMHLADSALPVGGFAFSNGLEAAVKSGMVASLPELERYLEGALAQWAAFDIPFLRLFSDDADETQLLRYDRMMPSPSMRKASFAQGRGWLRIFRDLFPQTDPEPEWSKLKELGLGPHYLPLFAATLKQAGASPDQIAELYLFTLLRDQTSAAVRLGLIGPSAAQSLQARLEKQLQQKLEEHSIQDPKRFTPLMDLSQMLQPSLYTKLFQN